jgi:hypothetical protein
MIAKDWRTKLRNGTRILSHLSEHLKRVLVIQFF